MFGAASVLGQPASGLKRHCEAAALGPEKLRRHARPLPSLFGVREEAVDAEELVVWACRWH